MKVRGREIKFLRTVKTDTELAKLCPDDDINRLGELLDDKLPVAIETGAKIIHLLNEGYEMNKHFDDPSYEPSVLSVDEIMYLSEDVFHKLIESAFSSLGRGTETSIELQDTKKKVKEKK